MITHDLTPNTPEWLAYRATMFNASDAPAMMGCSPYKTRAQLLREMHTGLAGEVDAGTQRRFDDGHRFEDLARPLAEQIIGESLYVVVGSEGRHSASFDGLTLAEDTDWEHKSLNDALRAILPAESKPATAGMSPTPNCAPRSSPAGAVRRRPGRLRAARRCCRRPCRQGPRHPARAAHRGAGHGDRQQPGRVQADGAGRDPQREPRPEDRRRLRRRRQGREVVRRCRGPAEGGEGARAVADGQHRRAVQGPGRHRRRVEGACAWIWTSWSRAARTRCGRSRDRCPRRAGRPRCAP
jgi:hypothetical protein